MVQCFFEGFFFFLGRSNSGRLNSKAASRMAAARKHERRRKRGWAHVSRAKRREAEARPPAKKTMIIKKEKEKQKKMKMKTLPGTTKNVRARNEQCMHACLKSSLAAAARDHPHVDEQFNNILAAAEDIMSIIVPRRLGSMHEKEFSETQLLPIARQSCNFAITQIRDERI